jgi:AraC-like DNA-binding protein
MEITTPHGSWHFRSLERGLVHCDRIHRFDRAVTTGVDASGPYWVLSVVSLERGRVRFVRDAERVVPSAKRYGLFIPPYGILQYEFHHVRQRCEILIGEAMSPGSFPREPIVFSPPRSTLPTALAAVPKFLADATDVRSVLRCSSPSAMSRRAKKEIDAHFDEPHSFAALAERLGVSHPAMTRGFKRDYGMAPAKYRTALRVFRSALTLLQGEEIAATAFRVGFEDLGRFYKQFRGVTGTTPARYRSRPRP